MGALEWIVSTAAISAVVAGAVSYWVLDFEIKLLQKRLNELERAIYLKPYDGDHS